MARLKRKTIKEANKSYQESHDIKKLSLLITIVNKGQGKAVTNLLKHYEVACSFIHRGEGTASESIYDILGLEENGKDVIFSVIRNDLADDIHKEIESFFMAAKKNNGVALRIKLDSLVGINTYRFLSNTF